MTGSTQRYACDRCHGQKLRCIHAGKAPCVRCARAKSTCVWSQSRRCRMTQPDSEGTTGRRINLQQKKQRQMQKSLVMSDTMESPMMHLATNTDDDIPASSVQASDSHNHYGLLLDQVVSSGSGDMSIDPSLGMIQFGGLTPAVYSSPASQEASEGHLHCDQTTGASTAITTGSPNLQWSSNSNECVIDSATEANWRQVFNREWEMLSRQQPATGNEMSVTSTPSGSNEDKPKPRCILDTVRQLSELHVELFTHGETVPKPPTSLSEPLSWKDKDFAIDRTFQLSQRLIDILNAQYPRFLETASTIGSATASSPDATTPPEEMSRIDESSCLLILSCYLRLVVVYDNIFGNMQACLDRSSITAREDYVNLPGVKVGSFTLPLSSSLQIVLILQLARNLLSRIGEILKAAGFDTSAHDDGADRARSAGAETNILLPSAIKTVASQESILMKRITQLRTTLISLNIL